MQTANELLPYEAQIKRNLALCGWTKGFEGRDREAARRLFSLLSHLEQVAVLAAERGDGVPGQLDDERAHRDTFRAIATELGGVDDAPEPVKALHDFLGSLHGHESLLCLNVIGEVWLENVFHHVARWGPWGPLIELIELDEARHSRDETLVPKVDAIVDPKAARPLVRMLEELLFNITADPSFMFPLAWFSSVSQLGQMGRRSLNQHKAAVARLGVEPGPYSREIALCGKHASQDVEPRKIDLTEWEAATFALDLRPIRGECGARWRHHTHPLDVETRLIRAVGAALADHPELDRTIVPARQELWQCAQPVVGVRRLYDRRRVMTVYALSPQNRTLQGLADRMRRAANRMRALPYRVPAVDPGLVEIAPPARVSATVTCVVGMQPPGSTGYSSLVPQEGATWSVCATGFDRRRWWEVLLRRPRTLRVSVEADHRAHNGLELGIFATALIHHLEQGPR